MGKTVTVPIRIDEDLLAKAEVEALIRGVTLAQIMNEALRKELGSKWA